uniref:Uncharacterized protein n=1 Tax=Spongospora subterranea TaxID=70186 RepID=A0A0H5R7V4_9EUKA|eukprot:CRZ04364.1 hypothetical protein [Spongospora subterranea]
MGDGNTRFRQPPRPPVRPFPNPTPQQGGLVKRLPSWSSRRATPHSLTAGDGSLPYADSIPAPDVMDNVPVGTFKKVVPADAVAEIPLFHQDIPPPPPYTNCIKIYLSGNTTKKLPNLRQNAVVPSMTSSAIPSRYSVPLRPAPPPPMQHEFTPVQPSLTPPAPYRLDAIVQNRAAPPPPLSLTPAPQSMRRVRPANAPSRPSGAGRPPPPPPRSRPPTTNAPAPPLPSQFPPSDDDDLLRGEAEC